jgi:prepilin peptidase CpaA
LPTTSEVISVAGVLVSGGTGAAVDLYTRRVPNALTLSAAALGITMAATGIGDLSAPAALLGFLMGFVVMLPGHVLGRTGGGDVKLMAALGTWLGPSMIVKAFLYSAIAGGVLALIVAIQRRRVGRTLRGVGRLIATPVSARQDVTAAEADNRFPYAPAIAAGSALVVLGF